MSKKTLVLSFIIFLYFVVGIGVHFYAISTGSLIGALPVLPNLIITGMLGIYTGVNTDSQTWTVYFLVNHLFNTGLIILASYAIYRIRYKNKKNASTH